MTKVEKLIETLRHAPPQVVTAWDPVNAPMVRQWCEVIGIDNPLYLDEEAARRGPHGALVAPPAMLVSWIMPGYRNKYPSGEPFDMQPQFAAAGFPGVFATNFEYSFDRCPHMGEMITRSSTITNVSDLKKTKVGEGYFLTQKEVYTGEGGRQVGVNGMNAFFFKPLEADAQSKPAANIELPKEDPAFPPVVIDITTSFIVAAAIATRDYTDIHHDRDASTRVGMKDIYMNILATVGLVQRSIETWYGPNTMLESVNLRLLSQCFPGDCLTFKNISSTSLPDGRLDIKVRGDLRKSVFADASVTVRKLA